MINLVIAALNIFVLLLFVRAVLSWFRPGPDSPIYPVVDVIDRATDPIVRPIRQVIPPMGGIDFSTLILIFFIRLFLIPMLANL